MDNLVHVKDSALKDLPFCGFAHGDGSLTWTSVGCAREMATCAECLSDVLANTCGLCGGSKTLIEYDEEWPCAGCGEEAAQAIIDSRGWPAPTPDAGEAP
jgi:hypothetical protein